jgi:hypothetical protein
MQLLHLTVKAEVPLAQTLQILTSFLFEEMHSFCRLQAEIIQKNLIESRLRCS